MQKPQLCTNAVFAELNIPVVSQYCQDHLRKDIFIKDQITTHILLHVNIQRNGKNNTEQHIWTTNIENLLTSSKTTIIDNEIWKINTYLNEMSINEISNSLLVKVIKELIK